ncbi:dienelactone hydrolase family protein [Pseudonocardia hydrocarbonoxydans]|uniref:Dienelactone hydrolase n=1 Tax=Pseudonocardia hydrocarbonoxydans TaxID=76726 RepID=A0A4Y3WNY4_9PSEU|nr:dienelactone hydrolase family protein [Pseudonocardia hydrocarbonoxydans]GEC19076.1 dienelactone hydrolase [Pseudonocardia hydrocarbonoxydans]
MFDTLDAGVAHAHGIGFGTVLERGRRAVEGLPAGLVAVGMSLGALPAQELAQTRPGALGAVLLHGCVPPSEFGGWPPGLPLQVHVMADDELGDVDEARELVAGVDGAELHLYPGGDHLFTDASLPVHDAAATDLVVGRMLGFLARS